MTTYTVMGIVDATVYETVEADSPEEAAESAYASFSPSVCHQCSEDLEVTGEVPWVQVLDEDGEEVYTDRPASAEEECLKILAFLVKLEKSSGSLHDAIVAIRDNAHRR